MIVLEEIADFGEYLDMELSEFFEFLVRIAYVATIDNGESAKAIPYRLKWLLQDLLQLERYPYVETNIEEALAEEDKDMFGNDDD
jgi:hypothetical protein